MSDSPLCRYTRSARRVRLVLVALTGAFYLYLLARGASTHGQRQAGVSYLLMGSLTVVPVVGACFTIADAIGCLVAWGRAKGRGQRGGLVVALAEVLLTPVLIYLEILGTLWLRF